MIARALIHAPALLLLDEPTAGLALDARLAVWDRIRALGGSGTTVLFATRHARDAERLASRVVVMDHGKILDSGSPDDLVARHAAGRVAELAGYPADVLAAVDEAGLRHEAAGERLLVRLSDERGELLPQGPVRSVSGGRPGDDPAGNARGRVPEARGPPSSGRIRCSVTSVISIRSRGGRRTSGGATC